MSTIETSHGSTVPASEIAARFAVALRRVAKWIRNSRSAVGQQPAYRLPLDARLLRDVGICDPKQEAKRRSKRTPFQVTD